LPTPNGSVLGFVDARTKISSGNMLAGATGIDFALLVVARTTV
jgi:selenocysteine-specific translation elongation factor